MFRNMDKKLRVVDIRGYDWMRITLKNAVRRTLRLKGLHGKGPYEIMNIILNYLKRVSDGSYSVRLLMYILGFVMYMPTKLLIRVTLGLLNTIDNIRDVYFSDYISFPVSKPINFDSVNNKLKRVQDLPILYSHLNSSSIGMVQKGPIFFGEIAQNIPYVFAPSYQNTLSAIIGRNLPEKFDVSNTIRAQFMDFGKNVVVPGLKLALLSELQNGELVYDMDAYLHDLDKPKRDEMLRGLRKIDSVDYLTKKFKAMPKIQKEVSVFEKNEGIAYPRTIVYMDALFRVLLGPLIKAMEKCWYKHLNGFYEIGNYTTLCSILGDMNNNIEGVFLSSDFSKFDRSRRPWMWECLEPVYEFVISNIVYADFSVYNDMDQENFNCTKAFREWSTNNKSLVIKLTAYMMEVSLAGQMASGNSNTNESNTVVSIILKMFLYWYSGIKFSFFKPQSMLYTGEAQEVLFLNKGDDNLEKIHSSKVEVLIAGYVLLFGKTGTGYQIKYLNIGGVDSIDFLSLSFIERPDGTIFAYKPLRKFFQTVSWTTTITNPQMKKHLLQMMYSEGHSIANSFGKLSIFKDVAQFLIRHGIKCDLDDPIFWNKERRYKIQPLQHGFDEDDLLFRERMLILHGIDDEIIKNFSTKLEMVANPFSIVEDTIIDHVYIDTTEYMCKYDVLKRKELPTITEYEMHAVQFDGAKIKNYNIELKFDEVIEEASKNIIKMRESGYFFCDI